MALIIKSLGGLRSDMPCGESIAGPTWFEICINSNWRDWWNTAVDVRSRVMARRAEGGVQSQALDAATAWLTKWADGPLGVLSALVKPDSTTDVVWSKDPGIVWSKAHFRDLVAYSVEGASVLLRMEGDDLFVSADADDERSLSALLIGAGAGVLATLIVALVVK